MAAVPRFVEQNVVAVLKGVVTGDGPLHPILADSGITLIGSNPTSPDDFISQSAVWVSAGLDYYGVLPRIIVEVLGFESSTFLAANLPGFEPIIQLQQTIADAVGLDLRVVRYAAAPGDFPAAAAQAVAEGTDAIHILTADAIANQLLKAIRDVEYDGTVIAGNALNFPQALTEDEATGIYAISQFYQDERVAPDDVREELEVFRRELEESAPNEDPEHSGTQGGFSLAMTVFDVIASIDGEITADSVDAAMRAPGPKRVFLGRDFDCSTNTRPPLAVGICGSGVQLVRWVGDRWEAEGDFFTILDLVPAP